jgi:hypothetical protein
MPSESTATGGNWLLDLFREYAQNLAYIPI